MNRILKSGILLAAFGLAGLPAAAQTSVTQIVDSTAAPAPGIAWSLDDCIGYALRNNIDIQQSALKVEKGEITLSTARYSRLPDLNASLGYNVSFGRGTSADNTYKTETLQTGSLDLSASMPIFEGFQINRKIKGGKLDLAAAVQDMERARENVSVNIMTLYLEVLFNQELVGIAERQLQLSTLQATRSKELFNAGKQPESAVYESEALKANDALTLTQARNDMQLALLKLSQALNRESAAGFMIVTPDMQTLLTPALTDPMQAAEAVYSTAVEQRPVIRAERLRLESSQNSVGIARSALYPSLSLRGGYGTGVYSSLDEKFFPQLRKNSSEFVGLSLNIPIFNRRATRNNIRTAQISANSQQLTLTNAEQTLRKEIEQAWYNATAASAKYRSAQAATSSAQEAFAYQEKKASAGRSTIFDFSDAKTRLEKAESELAQAKFELVFRRKILDYYRGEPLTL